MSKKTVQTRTEISVTNFEGVETKLEGVFLVGKTSKKVGGYPVFIGQIDVSANIDAMSLLAHGTHPAIAIDSKDVETVGEIPTCPTTDEPLWKYFKGSKKDKTAGYCQPIQSVYNRDTKPGHVDVLTESVERVGVDTKRRMVSFLTHPTTGQTHPVDGGHLITALARAELDNDSILTVQILQPQNVDSYAECLAGFDELQNERQVKDVLKAAGICPGWDSDIQIVLNKMVLLLSGKGLDSSGSSVPHIGAVNAKGKWTPRKLSKSEIAMLITKDFPGVEKLLSILHGLNTVVSHDVYDSESGDNVTMETPLFDYPTFRKTAKIAAWVLAINECSYSTRLDVTTIIDTIVGKIANDLDPCIAKLNAWVSGPVESDYPVLCSVIFAMCGVADLPNRKPQSRSSCLVKIAYDGWKDSQDSK